MGPDHSSIRGADHTILLGWVCQSNPSPSSAVVHLRLHSEEPWEGGEQAWVSGAPLCFLAGVSIQPITQTLGLWVNLRFPKIVLIRFGITFCFKDIFNLSIKITVECYLPTYLKAVMKDPRLTVNLYTTQARIGSYGELLPPAAWILFDKASP